MSEHFEVEKRRAMLFYPLPVVEIALGVLAGGVGTIALKKVIELITEDLYKVSKRFLKSIFSNHTPRTELRLTFEITGTRFEGEVSQDASEATERAIGTLPEMFRAAENLLATHRLPQHLVLSELNPKDEQNVQSLGFSCPLPFEPDWVRIQFYPEVGGWQIERIHKE